MQILPTILSVIALLIAIAAALLQSERQMRPKRQLMQLNAPRRPRKGKQTQ
jgi:hypothetical protein